MSTTPISTPILHPISIYLKSHERLVLLAIAGLVLWFGIGKVDTLIANHDNANLQQATIVANTNAEKTKTLAEVAQKQADEYAVLSAHDQAQNIALEQVNAQLVATLAQRQKTDATLPPSGLAARWHELVPQVTTSNVNAGQMTVNAPGVSATVQQLELVPVLSTQLENERAQLENAQALLRAEGEQVSTLNTEVSSLNLQLKDNQVVFNQQVAVVKAEARKSKRHWFYAGVVVGFIGRQIIKSYTGL